MFSYFLKFIFFILFFEDVFYLLEATSFISSDLCLAKLEEVVELLDKHGQSFLVTIHYNTCNKIYGDFIWTGDLRPQPWI